MGDPNDPVAISFWIISIAMVAATVFFLMESTAVSFHWKTSLNVGALVTLVAAVHYFYMREYWVQLGSSPIVYRYIDWTMRIIVSAGWSVYPLGYFFGYLQGSVKADQLNLIYNVADVINKIAFCLAIWHSAKKDTAEKGESLLA